MRLGTLLLGGIGSNTCVNLDFTLRVDLQVLGLGGALLEKGARILLAQLAEGLANVRILHTSKLCVAHVLDHNLIMLLTFLEFFDFMVRDKMLFQLDP